MMHSVTVFTFYKVIQTLLCRNFVPKYKNELVKMLQHICICKKTDTDQNKDNSKVDSCM